MRWNRYELFQTLSLYPCTVPQSWKSYIFFCQNRETRFQSHFSFFYFRVPSSTVIRDTLIFRTLKQERNTQRENARIQRKMLVACVCACVKTSWVVCSSRIYECGVWFPWPPGIQIRSRSFLISRSFMRFARSYRVHCHVVGRVTSEAKRDVSAFGIESLL